MPGYPSGAQTLLPPEFTLTRPFPGRHGLHKHCWHWGPCLAQCERVSPSSPSWLIFCEVQGTWRCFGCEIPWVQGAGGGRHQGSRWCARGLEAPGRRAGPERGLSRAPGSSEGSPPCELLFGLPV